MSKFNMSALLNEKSKANKQGKCPRTGFVIQYINIEKLIPDNRNFYSVEDVGELKESILMFGLEQNLSVRANQDDTYTVVSGHRRLKALKELVEEGNIQFEEVPCKVEAPLDEVKAELQLIFANSTTRILSDYEKTYQASRIKELLTMLKNSGFKLPGRMREIVADAMNVSKTQVERMELINNKLLPEFMKEFKDKKITITVAHELSRLPKLKQEAAYLAYKDKGSFSINDIKAYQTEKPVDEPNSESPQIYEPVKENSPETVKEEDKPEEGIKPVTEEEKEPEKERQSLKIYVCSPYGGLDENYLKACGYCTRVAAEGHIPFASHVMLHNILEEPEGREKGITAGLEMIKIVDELWVFGEEITDGMNREIEEAKRLGIIKIVYCMEEVS